MVVRIRMDGREFVIRHEAESLLELRQRLYGFLVRGEVGQLRTLTGEVVTVNWRAVGTVEVLGLMGDDPPPSGGQDSGPKRWDGLPR